MDQGYEPGKRFPRVTGSVHRKRLSLRVAPNRAWGGEEAPYWTPFVMTAAGGKRITLGEYEVARVPFVFFGDSIHTIAYLAKRGDGQYAITANPLQNCSHDCAFCCRGYSNMEVSYKRQLINLTPREMARYLRVVFPQIDFGLVREIAFITGVFPNDDYLLSYIDEFLVEMKVVSEGRFDPRENSHQWMKVSSHLLRTEHAMRTAKELGIKRFTYTVELVDPYQRSLQMNLANPRRAVHVDAFRPLQWMPAEGKPVIPRPARAQDNTKRLQTTVKGSATFEEVMAILDTAGRIFGQHQVEPVLILGLDTYDETMAALRRLHAEKFRMLTRSLYNAYDADQIPLYRMNLEEVIAVSEFARKHFVSGHRQVVDENDSYVVTLNPIRG